MATTTNYSWTTPDNTAYVKDGASAIRTLGSSVDTTLYTALGGAYPGLRLIKKQTVGSAVSSVTVTNAFSATYENYKILWSGGNQSGSFYINLKLGSNTANYNWFLIYGNYGTSTVNGLSGSATANFSYVGFGNTTTSNLSLELSQPFLSENTFLTANHVQTTDSGAAGTCNGVLNDTSSYTAFTLTPSTGTMTGGTIYVYGYGIS